MVITSDKYYFLGKFGNDYFFFGKNEKSLMTVYDSKIKWIDKKNNIVYFIDGNNVSYSYSAIKHHSKDFLDKELEKLYDILNREFYVGQVLKYKSVKNKRYHNAFIEISKIRPLNKEGDCEIYFIWKKYGTTCHLSKRDLISHTLHC